MTDFTNAPKILKPGQVQKLLQISRNTFFRWVAEGKLPGAFKIGDSWRVDRDKLEAWIDEQAQKPRSKDKKIKPKDEIGLIS
ncbi:MAG TPA: helix-turn-helix domain-containing protein [archaeon]|nr:helix-turn-helix domain-containing protein [archaeon]